jgi:PKD repeat protein
MQKSSCYAFILTLLCSACRDVPMSTDFETEDTVILAGSSITFQDRSEGGSTTWNWIFEGGTPSTSLLNIPTVKYDVPGEYDVSLTTSNGDNTDSEIKTDYITVLGAVDASFTLSASRVDVNTPVVFTDNSTGSPTKWEWTFPGGTPATSTAQNPTVTYAKAGVYSVTLKASHDLSTDLVTVSGALLVQGLVSHYKLDGNTIDSGPLNLIATAVGAQLSTDRKGIANAAYSFDGIDDYIEMPYNAMVKALPVTVSFWIKFDVVSANILATDYSPNQFSGVGFVASKSGTTVNNLGINIGSGSGGLSSEYRRTFVTDYTLQTGQWYHIVGVFENISSMKAYVNGVVTGGTYAGTATTYAIPNNVGTLGKTGNPSDLFKGSIDDFRVYNKVLSSAEIAALFAE